MNNNIIYALRGPLHPNSFPTLHGSLFQSVKTIFPSREEKNMKIKIKIMKLSFSP